MMKMLSVGSKLFSRIPDRIKKASVGSLVVPLDSAEMIEVIELLKQLPLDVTVVTGDAAFTFRTIIEAIRERGGDYFLFVKANQPELEGEIARKRCSAGTLTDQAAVFA